MNLSVKNKEQQPTNESFENENRTRFDDLGLPSSRNMSVEEFIEAYHDGLERSYSETENAHPLHPVTGEPGTFVRYSRQYPIYRTSSGDEFIVQRGIPKLLRKP